MTIDAVQLVVPSSLAPLGAPAELVVKATLVLALAALAARLLRAQAASARHLAWMLGLAGVLVLPLASTLAPRVRLVVPGLEASHARPEAPDGAAARPLPPGSAWEAPSRDDAKEDRIVFGGSAPRAGTGRAVVVGLSLAWLAGALLAFVRFARSLAEAVQLVRRSAPSRLAPELDELAWELGLTRRVRLLESARVPVPLTFGALRPVVVVPEGFDAWTAERRRAALLHELAHVRRHDWLVFTLAQVVAAACWFHPLVHAAVRALHREAEAAADDLVIAGGTRPSAHAAHLLDLVRNLNLHPGSSAMTVSMLGGTFDARIRALLDRTRARGPVPLRVRAALVAATGACVLAFGSVDVVAAPAPQAEHSLHGHVKHVLGELRRLDTPDSPGEWYDRGMSYHEEGQYERAIECFQKSLEGGKKRGAATYNIACGHALLGHADLAFEWLERAAQEGFEVGDYLWRDQDLAGLRGDARFAALAERHADPEERARLAARLAELSAEGSKDADDWNDVALELLQSGRHAEAADAYARALALEPHGTTGMYNRACALALAGRADAALDQLEKAVEGGWDDAEHAREDGDLASLRGTKRFETILQSIESLEFPSEWSLLGWQVGPDRAEWKGVLEAHESYVAKHPQASAVKFRLGLAALKAGEPRRAQQAFEATHAEGYKPATSAYNVACALALQGESNRAFEWLGRARAEGFEQWGLAREDEDLASLRDDPRFDELVPRSSSWHHRILRTL